MGWLKLFVFFGIFFSAIASLILASEITGKIITGEVTQQTHITISVDADPPSLIVFSPQNKTYNYANGINLNYSSSDTNGVNKIWYVLDSGFSVYLYGNTSIDVTDAQSHTIVIYSNDTFNQINSTSITFYVNSTAGYNVTADKYNSTSTNLTQLAIQGKSYMGNISNFRLEMTGYGKIIFTDTINLSRDIDLNPESMTNISFNSIFINSTALPELNKPATLYLEGLNFTNPQILKDGEVCFSSICIIQSYSGGTLIFNVTSFSTYSAEETSALLSPGGSGISGGGSSSSQAVITISDFTLNKDKIQISLKKGGSKNGEIEIKNTGAKKIHISIKSSGIEELANIAFEFDLDVKESKLIEIPFTAQVSEKEDLYIGSLSIKSAASEKIIPLIVEVVSSKSLFDVSINIPPKYNLVEPGEEMVSEIYLKEVEKIGKVDVNVEYQIKNLEGKMIISNKETLAVEDEKSFLRYFKIPSDIPYGKYILYVKVTYNGEVASASNIFEVNTTNIFLNLKNIPIFSTILLILFLIILLIEIRKVKKEVKALGYVDEKKLDKLKYINHKKR